jgi:hypothetical protein
MRRVHLALAIVLALAAAPAAQAAPSGHTVAKPGAWCWFADPRAIEYRGHAVFGWVDGAGDIMVGDETGRRATLASQLQRDDHANPAFYIRKDGRLMAFWSAHYGTALYYRTATSLTHWGPTRTAPANPAGPSVYSNLYTYPNPRRVGKTLYLFWSGVNTTATYATSTDDGETWSEARPLFDPSEPPVRYIKYEHSGDEIHMAYTMGHPRARISSLYHAIIRKGRIWKQDGTQIGKLGTPMSPWAGNLIYSPQGDGPPWVHDLAVKHGKPYIVFATFPTLTNHSYHYATWNGGWRNQQITRAGPSFNEDPLEAQYSGGISLNHRDPRVAYLSRKVAGQFEIERWVRKHKRWTHRAITRDSAQQNVRPFRVGRGLAWMRGSYPSYTGFQTELVWRGP